MWSYLICDVYDCVHATATELIGSDTYRVVLSVPKEKKKKMLIPGSDQQRLPWEWAKVSHKGEPQMVESLAWRPGNWILLSAD